MILDLFIFTLLGCILMIIRFLFYKLNPINKVDLDKKRLEMIGFIKWTAIFSLVGFIVLSIFAVIYVVFGSNFYDFFIYYDDFDMEEKSFFFTYRLMFFVGIISLVVFSFLGGKIKHILSGKLIDEDLSNIDNNSPTKRKLN